ncbi:MAG: PorV/PorQ family protein [Candidatus Marinimicrobia bacterium]|nr:PorV/PorQ family protein [Candidatus Neomarinimicrobiota bacterium]
MKKRYLMIGLLILLIISSQSVFASAPKLGTAGASELLIPMGAKNVAVGGSNIANVSGTDAIYWNPAGLAMVKTGAASFTQMSYFADMKVSYLAAAVNAQRIGTFGVSLQILSIGDIPVTTDLMPEGTGEVLSPDYLTLGVTYAKRFTDRILFGTNAKLISEKIGTMSASAAAFDFGLQYVSPWGIAFGVTMKNIGSSIKFDGTGIEFDSPITYADPSATTRKTKLDMASHELPTSMNLGLAYTYDLASLGKVNFTGSYNNNSFEIDHVNFGAEYGFNNMLFVRAGYTKVLYPDDWEYDTTSQFGLSFGLGLNLKLAGSNIAFDYANRPMELFDANQYFAVSFGL